MALKVLGVFLLLIKADKRFYKEGNHDAIIFRSVYMITTDTCETNLGFCIMKQGLLAIMIKHSFNICYVLHTLGCIYQMCKCIFQDSSLLMYNYCKIYISMQLKFFFLFFIRFCLYLYLFSSWGP